jgi:hypothetical protein
VVAAEEIVTAGEKACEQPLSDRSLFKRMERVEGVLAF